MPSLEMQQIKFSNLNPEKLYSFSILSLLKKISISTYAQPRKTFLFELSQWKFYLQIPVKEIYPS